MGQDMPMPRLSANRLTNEQRKQLTLEWALRRGYPVPKRPTGPFMILLVILGLLAGGIPGLLLLVWLVLRERDYHKQIDQLMIRWADWHDRRSDHW